jgi:glycine/D-amino acid oxidase-like deaminating enzyme
MSQRAKIVVLGGGIVGLSTVMLLAKQHHNVTVFERDSDSLPSSPTDAREAWDRRGVVQFRQPHYLHSAGRLLLDQYLPEVSEALLRSGGLSAEPARWRGKASSWLRSLRHCRAQLVLEIIQFVDGHRTVTVPVQRRAGSLCVHNLHGLCQLAGFAASSQGFGSNL